MRWCGCGEIATATLHKSPTVSVDLCARHVEAAWPRIEPLPLPEGYRRCSGCGQYRSREWCGHNVTWDLWYCLPICLWGDDVSKWPSGTGRCLSCKGEASIAVDIGGLDVWMSCPDCKGTGRIW